MPSQEQSTHSHMIWRHTWLMLSEVRVVRLTVAVFRPLELTVSPAEGITAGLGGPGTCQRVISIAMPPLNKKFVLIPRYQPYGSQRPQDQASRRLAATRCLGRSFAKPVHLLALALCVSGIDCVRLR